jgi:hypothetical protein
MAAAKIAGGPGTSEHTGGLSDITRRPSRTKKGSEKIR